MNFTVFVFSYKRVLLPYVFICLTKRFWYEWKRRSGLNGIRWYYVHAFFLFRRYQKKHFSQQDKGPKNINAAISVAVTPCERENEFGAQTKKRDHLIKQECLGTFWQCLVVVGWDDLAKKTLRKHARNHTTPTRENGGHFLLSFLSLSLSLAK